MDLCRAFLMFLLIILLGLIESILAMTTLLYNVTEESAVPLRITNIIRDGKLEQTYQPDVVSKFQWKIIPTSKYKHFFNLDSQTGELFLNKVVDRDTLCPGATQCEISVDISVEQEQIDISELFKVKVNILDVNDIKPLFKHSLVTRRISEGVPVNSEYPVPLALDGDSPKYTVKQYSVNNTELFKVKTRTNSNGDITRISLVLQLKLDRENTEEYYVELTAKDGGSPSLSGACIIHIIVTDTNDNAPQFEKNTYNINIHELTQKDTFLLKVTAFDRDSSQNGLIRYYISEQSINLYGEPFRIDENSGSVFVNNALDYESQNRYEISIVAEDKTAEKLSDHATLIVNIIDDNDNAPVIDTGDNNIFVVTEEMSKEQLVTYVSVTDLDNGVNGQYTCSTNDQQFHLISTTSKDLFRLVTAGKLDREVLETLKVSVLCSDHGEVSLKSQKDLTVIVKDINDNSPIFSQTHYTIAVPENNQIGLLLDQVIAIDKDRDNNGVVEYYVDPEFKSFIRVDRNTGSIQASKRYDRETLETLNFNVYARDKGSPPRKSEAMVTLNIIDQNDERPVFDSDMYSFVIHENQAANSTIGFVSANDKDLAPNNRYTYEIAKPGNALSLFEINSYNGEITVKKSLDFEEKNHYEFIVVVADTNKPILRSSTVVRVSVIDLNDNAPEFVFPNEVNHTVLVPFNAPAGHMVAKASAVDIDSSTNGQFTYSMTPEHGVDYNDYYFKIDPESGIIISTTEMNREFVKSIDIYVKDCGKPQLTSSVTLTIKVNKSLLYEGKASSYNSAVNRTIIVVLTVIFIFLVIILTFAIYLVLRRRRNSLRNPKKTAPVGVSPDIQVCTGSMLDQGPVDLYIPPEKTKPEVKLNVLKYFYSSFTLYLPVFII